MAAKGDQEDKKPLLTDVASFQPAQAQPTATVSTEQVLGEMEAEGSECKVVFT
jgi:hypothetical protein